MRIDSNLKKGRSILESLKTKRSGKVINEDQVTDMSYVPEPQGQNVPQAKQSLDKDEKDALMKQYPEYWNFEKMWHPEYKKLWQNASSYSEKQQVEIINDIIGQAATALGLNWDWIKDDTYLFGFYLINGSEKNMIIKVPYDFSFPSLRTKLLNWFKKTKEVNPGKKKAIKVSESFGQAVKGNTGSIENAAGEFDAEVSPIEFGRIIREGLVDLHYKELSREEFFKDNSFVPWSWVGVDWNSIDQNNEFVISLGDGPVPLQVTITGKNRNGRCEAFLMFSYLKEDYNLLRLGSIFHLGKSDRRMTTSYAYNIVELLANIRKHWNKVSTEIIRGYVPYNNEEALTKSIIAFCVGDVPYLNEGFGQSVKSKDQSVSDIVGELSEKTINEFIDKIKDYAIEIGWTPFDFYDLKHSYFDEEGQWGFPDDLRDMQFCLYSRESDDFGNKGLIVLLSFDLDCINTWHSILIQLKYVDPDTQDTYDGDIISRGHTFTTEALTVISNILERATHLRESGTFRCFNHLDPDEALKVDKSIAKQLCINIPDNWLITEGFGAGVKSTSVDKPHEIAKAFDRKMDSREFSLDLKEIAMDNGYTPVSVEWDDYGHPRDLMPETFVETKKNSISWASYFGLYSNESFYLCLKVTYGGVDDDSMFVGYDLLVSTNADKTTTSNATFYTSTLFDNRSFNMSTSSLDMLSRVLQKAKSSIDKIEEICKDKMIGQFASFVNPDTPLYKVGKLIEEAHLNEGFGVGVKNAPLTKGDVIREISYLDWFTFTEKLMNKIAYSNLPFAFTQSPIFEIGRVYVPLDEESEPEEMKFMIFSKEDYLESTEEYLEDGQKDIKISLMLQKGPEASMFALSVQIEDEDDTCKSKTLHFGQKNYMTHVSIERLMSFFEILSKMNPGMDIASKFAKITDATDESAKNARDILQGYIDDLRLNEGFGQKIKKERGDMTDEEWRDHLNKMRAKDFDYTSREFIHRYCKKTHVLKSKGGFMIGEVPCYDYDKYLHILSDFLRKNDVEVDGELHMQLYPEDETICIEDNSSLYARIRDLGEMYTEMFKYNAIDTIGLFMRMASLIYNRRLDNGDLKSEFLTSLQKHQELNEGFATSVKRDAASPDVNGTLGDFSGKKMVWDEWRSNLIEALEKNGIERDDTGKTAGTFMVSGTAGISYILDLPLDDNGLMQRFSLCIAGDYEHEYEGFYLMFSILNIGGGYVFPRSMNITPASFKRWYNSYFGSMKDAGHKTYEVTPAAYNCILELILDLHKNLDIVKKVVEANKDQMNKQGSMGIKKIVSNIMLSIQ